MTLAAKDNQDHNKETRGRLVIVANRLPVTVTKDAEGLHFQDSVGGLATGLSCVSSDFKICWVGWPGIATNELKDSEKEQVVNKLTEKSAHPVFLSKEQVEGFYEGFCEQNDLASFSLFSHQRGL